MNEIFTGIGGGQTGPSEQTYIGHSFSSTVMQ